MMFKRLLLIFLCSPVTLMAAPQPATPASSASAPSAQADKAGTPAPNVEIDTSAGDIVIELYPDKAPRSVKNFLRYVRAGFYDGTVFHRVIKGFLIQGGLFTRELSEKRTHSTIPDEANNGLSNLRGTVSAARVAADPDSATAQFFINVVDNPRLDFVSEQNGLTWGYAVFGRVIKGMDVVDKINALPTRPMGPFPGDVPNPLVVIKHAQVVGEPAAAASGATPAKATSAQ